ncbi:MULTISPECIES: winged helix-turn-helix domain-containing protein [Shewanella]|uniref:winged helix-turn-helix domain-containing protein n=1 Tax=Shewanella TaxID=22 RepID=UPI00128BF5C8|nr:MULTISPECIES: helix-turn-helix domain-containing protein [Shewanella]
MDNQQELEIFDIANKYLFNTQTHKLTAKTNNGKAVVELGLNESRLLTLLIKHEGAPVTREKILHEVWKKRGLVVDETSVNQTISQIRKQLNDDAKVQAIIKTLPKLGYSLSPGVSVKRLSQAEAEATYPSKPCMLSKKSILVQVAIAAALAITLNVIFSLNSVDTSLQNATTPWTEAKIAGVNLLQLQHNPINKTLTPLIEKCVHAFLTQSPNQIDTLLISSDENRSLTLMPLIQGSSKTLVTILNRDIAPGENTCFLK